MKKAIAIITLLTVSWTYAAQTMETDKLVKAAIQDVNTTTLSGKVTNINQFNSVLDSASKGSYIAAGIAAANLITTLAPQYTAFTKDATLQNMQASSMAFGQAVVNAAQNYQKLDVVDQYIQKATQQYNDFWNYRVAFLTSSDAADAKAQQMNYFLNYLTLNGIKLASKGKNMQEVADSYAEANRLAYQLPVDAYNIYMQYRDDAQKMLNVNQDQLVSEIQALRANARVQNISQISVDVNNAIEAALNKKYEIRIFGFKVTTFSIPKKLKDFVHNAEQKTGAADAYQALQFFMMQNTQDGKPSAAVYSEVLKNKDTNSFAKLMVVLANNLSAHFTSLTPEEAYYAIGYQLANQLIARM
ncbi:hypothetical protein [Facilibium subflavum]|uniref:hypothetical protein n=1 Tax=Facilibium subflavum TaxID=2219058 RepID=UPI000E6574E4|nr:hypothetical protein [Facilibium subflavum]